MKPATTPSIVLPGLMPDATCRRPNARPPNIANVSDKTMTIMSHDTSANPFV